LSQLYVYENLFSNEREKRNQQVGFISDVREQPNIILLNGKQLGTQSMEFCVSETPKLNGLPFSSFQRNRTAKAVLEN
jgi:hypothetical protein